MEGVDEAWTPPPQIDEFRVERRLGQGGMGEVWLARDTLLERDVALKFATFATTDEALLQFRVEARAVARLQHPNIVAVHRAGELADRPFLVTELLRGQSLDRVERLATDQVVALGADLARGLAAAHAAGVIHRDIKPANAFLCEDGVAKLLDFGLAQLRGGPMVGSHHSVHPAAAHPSAPPGPLDSTQAAPTGNSQTWGTPLYMAPETWRGEPATRPTDVYSLGALLCTLLTGRPPYDGNSTSEMCAAVLEGPLPRIASSAPDAPAPLVDLVLQCLSRNREARPSAEEVCLALLAMLASERDGSADDTGADPDASPYRGLLSFGAEHRSLFFGREVETAAVLTALRGSPFVLVVGPSGVGKSSLVRAGVVPRVLAGALGREAWRATVLVPGERPIERLAQALSHVLDAPADEVAAGLASSPAWAAARIVERGGRERVLLVVDQLEEAWTLSPAPERAALFEAVAALTRIGPMARVVATLRADFLSQPRDLGGLRSEALRAPVVLGPMSSDGLRRAITEPARRRGVHIEPDLVDRLLDSARGASGMLPLLEFALGVLWERRDRLSKQMSASDLDALGGLEGALAAHADAALGRIGSGLASEARRLLLALVTVGRTRARRDERDLLGSSPDARAALDALIDARLVVASAGDDTTTYELAHEVLLSGWPTLGGWLDDESAARHALEHMREAASEWERIGRDPEALFGDRQLEQLEALEGRDLPPGTDAFVAQSRAAVRRARLRRLLRAVGIPLALALLGGAAWAASFARHRADVARAVAEARRLDAQAEQTTRAADRARAEAFEQFERDDLGPAETLWKQTLALEEETDRLRRDVGATLDAALALDAGNAAARTLYADVTLRRLLAAERLHEGSLLAELRGRLDVYDDGSRAASLRAPGHVHIETDPPGATLTLARYREDAGGRLVESYTAPVVTSDLRGVDPGSYLILARAADRYATRYPFFVRRGEVSTLRIVLPPAADVPPGMVYVPGGRTLYGSSEDEATREFLAHQPVHDVQVGPFLIARTEVTNAQYVAFLGSLPQAERRARLPSRLALMDDGRIAWKMRDRIFAQGEPYCGGVEGCVDWLGLPVGGTSREDGEHFTAWLARSGNLPGARLCTDREWERAARGADDRQFPAGNADLGPSDACTLATYGGDVSRAGPCTAGMHPASRSPFGVDDLSGSEWEWTSGPGDVAQPAQGVVRGAGWLEFGLYLAISNRAMEGSGLRSYHYGLRVCASAR